MQKIQSELEAERLKIQKLRLEVEQLEIETQFKYLELAKEFLEPYLSSDRSPDKQVEYLARTCHSSVPC